MVGTLFLVWLAFICFAFGWVSAALWLVAGAGIWLFLWSLHATMQLLVMLSSPPPRR